MCFPLDFHWISIGFPLDFNSMSIRLSNSQVRFEGEAWQELQAEGKQLELDEVFLRRWGLPYFFTLEGAVQGEEYILPWEAFEELATSFGLRLASSLAE